jgi:hypothetical protein
MDKVDMALAALVAATFTALAVIAGIQVTEFQKAQFEVIHETAKI